MQVNVIFDARLLKSAQTMAEAIYQLQVSQENHFFSRKWCNLIPDSPASEPMNAEVYQDGLLRPPNIDFADIERDDPRDEPIIFISAAEDAGEVRIFVCILDEHGNVIDQGPAFHIPGSGTEWGFALQEPIASGSPIHVSVHLIDCLGALRVEHHDLIIP